MRHRTGHASRVVSVTMSLFNFLRPSFRSVVRLASALGTPTDRACVPNDLEWRRADSAQSLTVKYMSSVTQTATNTGDVTQALFISGVYTRPSRAFTRLYVIYRAAVDMWRRLNILQ